MIMLLEIHASVVVGFIQWHVKISKNHARLIFMDPQNIPHQILYDVEFFNIFYYITLNLYNVARQIWTKVVELNNKVK